MNLTRSVSEGIWGQNITLHLAEALILKETMLKVIFLAMKTSLLTWKQKPATWPTQAPFSQLHDVSLEISFKRGMLEN